MRRGHFHSYQGRELEALHAVAGWITSHQVTPSQASHEHEKSRYSLAAAAFDLEARPRVELG